MKKLLVVAAFAVLGAYPAAACEWNREASTQDTVVAAATDQTPQAAPACSGADCAAPKAESTASEQTAAKPVFEPAPVVLVTDRH
jgi:hypothetical protein